eukprot:1125113-Pyramimonas_sp.AAC.1
MPVAPRRSPRRGSTCSCGSCRGAAHHLGQSPSGHSRSATLAHPSRRACAGVCAEQPTPWARSCCGRLPAQLRGLDRRAAGL